MRWALSRIISSYKLKIGVRTLGAQVRTCGESCSWQRRNEELNCHPKCLHCKEQAIPFSADRLKTRHSAPCGKPPRKAATSSRVSHGVCGSAQVIGHSARYEQTTACESTALVFRPVRPSTPSDRIGAADGTSRPPENPAVGSDYQQPSSPASDLNHLARSESLQ